ncbi:MULTISPECIES: acetolactate decarboxylase [Legionella]|uniref:Alpha-acetolactate decarboxylase n=1 Tax=Legionella septentrionalis TaxID=2498109 RepID=A0A3S0VA16_9GAMM|nr:MULTISPECIES: acetolactate decarboxylase [Legionella]MCP0914996.1 acetolactate decarboxylase [Legionella sp. 27cVA30]RUQ84435.1 acetolactate decarboxylase [Legionella septentrionalis]RUQ94663.1 acetolactate decarboxylase [Legionella septentrionalis]RUR09238.1 acetolactate decarboxylase [Legionella septentrionalis]RUR12201.1 acetolactate decarboxylase [Legionella septentrionalis]
MSILYQYSHFLAVSKGCYDGGLSIKELKKHGNLGLGTFHALDGELVVIDNQFYHCANGQTRLAEDSELLPWAAIANLGAGRSFTIKNIVSIEELQSVLLAHVPTKNYPAALRIKAHAANIALGSVPKQTKPYKAISAIIEDSILINTGEITADLGGFYTPEFMFPMKAKGIHLHFVDENRRIGGHVLELQLISAEIYWQQLTAINIIFPQADEYKNANLSLADNLPKFEDKLNQ